MSNQYLDITNVQIFSSKEEIKKVCYKCFSKKYIRIALTQYTLLEAYSSICKRSIKGILHSIRSAQSDEQKTQLLDDMVQAIAAKCGFSKYVSKYQLLLEKLRGTSNNFSDIVLKDLDDINKINNYNFENKDNINYQDSQNNQSDQIDQDEQRTNILYKQHEIKINCAQIFSYIFSQTRSTFNLNDYSEYILQLQQYLNDTQNIFKSKQEKSMQLVQLIKSLNQQHKNSLSYNQTQALLGFLAQQFIGITQ